MNIVDFHIHIFSKVSGRNQYGPVESDSYGRIRNDGKTKPFIPSFCQETTFPLPNLCELMRRHDVGKALLLQNPTIGTRNEEIENAITTHQRMFYGVVQTDPFAADAQSIIETYGKKKSFFALKLELSQDWGWLGIHRQNDFKYANLYPLIDCAQSNKLSVILDIGDHTGPAYSPDGLQALVENFPHTLFVIEHLGYYTKTTPLTTWKNIINLGKRDNVYFGISAVAKIIDDDYPCPKALRLIGDAFSIVGSHKLLWGSDGPTTLTHYTYRQLIDMILLHANFLSGSDKRKIMGGNALELFGQ